MKKIEKSVKNMKGEEIERATLDNEVQELTKQEVLERFIQQSERRQLPNKSWLDYRVF